jgi:FixJ family two-component response regulator
MIPEPPAAGTDTAPTVYVVDDDLPFLRSLTRLLRVSGYDVVMHNSADELLDELHAGSHGCVVTDLMMPGMDGMALQQALHDRGNPIPVVFLTGQGDIPASVRAMRNGAEDFLTKNAPKKDILAAIERALAHSRVRLAKRNRDAAVHRALSALTAREHDVLRFVVAGKPNKQIASDLGLHERTVKLHRTHLCNKLGIHSVAELTRLAQHAGILD